MIPETLDALRVPVTELKSYGRNPRRGSVEAIKNSLEVHGQYRPIVVNRRTGEVLAGNHTLAAARELGWDDIAATYVDVDDDQAARIVLVDNRSNDVAGYDELALADLLRSLPDLDGTGFEQSDLDALLETLDPADRTEGDTAPGDPPAEPRTVPGDLYVLGDHRLLCGDATQADAVQRLLDGAAPDMLVTDPPYGVSYVGKTKDALTIDNDAMGAEATGQLWADALTIAGLKAGGIFYATVPPGPLLATFMAATNIALGPDALRQVLIWVKDRFVLGHSDYHYRHEPILYGWAPGVAHYFGADRTQDSVWEIARPGRSEEHPTMKPVDLFERALINSAKSGDAVYDPFGGSGTTMLACENQGQRARLMELDPGYCDVIVDRWERHTGRQAQRGD